MATMARCGVFPVDVFSCEGVSKRLNEFGEAAEVLLYTVDRSKSWTATGMTIVLHWIVFEERAGHPAFNFACLQFFGAISAAVIVLSFVVTVLVASIAAMTVSCCFWNVVYARACPLPTSCNLWT